MASWKLGTCGCRIPGVATPYPYFRALAASCRRTRPQAKSFWTGGPNVGVGQFVKIKDEASFDRARLYECIEAFTVPTSTDDVFFSDVMPKLRELQFDSDGLIGDFSRYVFRFGSFPLTSQFSVVAGAIWAPDQSPIVRRISSGNQGAGGPSYPQWEVYKYERFSFPDYSRPLTFSKWIESTEWSFPVGSLSVPTGRLEREYTYNPNNRTESFLSRAYDGTGARTDSNGESPMLNGQSTSVLDSAGSQLGWPNGYNTNHQRMQDFDIQEDFQSYVIVSGNGVVTQSVRVLG